MWQMEPHFHDRVGSIIGTMGIAVVYYFHSV